MKSQRIDSSLDQGLDLFNPYQTTEEEKAAFRDWYAKSGAGQSHIGLDFWLDNHPEALKRYRLWASYLPEKGADRHFNLFSNIALYGLLGYERGVFYCAANANRGLGLSKAETLEGMALSFFFAGPCGSETIAKALERYEWIDESDRPDRFPGHWEPDPQAFKSGLDFSSMNLTNDERGLLDQWYIKWEGEIPGYVKLLGELNPQLLKAYRARFENTLRLLPKQLLPHTFLHFNVMRGFGEGVRENVLLAKGFGMTRADVMGAISNALVVGSVEAASIVDAAAGDILRSWDRQTVEDEEQR